MRCAVSNQPNVLLRQNSFGGADPTTRLWKKTEQKSGHFSWLGWRDSNPRMHGPKPCALPLGDTPMLIDCEMYFAMSYQIVLVMDTIWFTRALHSNSHAPYHLATPQCWLIVKCTLRSIIDPQYWRFKPAYFTGTQALLYRFRRHISRCATTSE